MTPRFAIHYADGTVYEGGGISDELVPVTVEVSRDWLAAPQDRVLGIIVENKETGRVVLRGGEWYFPTADGEYGFSDDLGAWMRKLNGSVKRGEYVSSEEMAAFWRWAKNYSAIPKGA